MAETKRVSDQYTISAPTIIIDGNLTLTGSTTTVNTVNSTINDNIIVFNSGETTAQVTAGFSGIEIERGTSENASWLFNESDDVWEAKINGSLLNLRTGTPVSNFDCVNKAYVTSIVSNNSPGLPTNSIQFNNSGAFAGSSLLTWNGTTFVAQDLTLTTSTLSTTATNGNININATGTGFVAVQTPINLKNVGADPSAVTSSSLLYSKTPGNAGTGIFYVNTTSSDELVSKSKSILFGLIF